MFHCRTRGEMVSADQRGAGDGQGAGKMSEIGSAGLSVLGGARRRSRQNRKVEAQLTSDSTCRALLQRTRRERRMLTIDMEVGSAMPGRPAAPCPGRSPTCRAENASHWMIRPGLAAPIAAKSHDGRSPLCDGATVSPMSSRASSRSACWTKPRRSRSAAIARSWRASFRARASISG